MENPTIKFNPTNNVFKFPIKEYLAHIASHPAEGARKWCATCSSFTQRKCSLCKMVPFCSGRCEQEGKAAHVGECARLGGCQDPKLAKIKELTVTVEELTKALSAQESKCSSMLQTQQLQLDRQQKLEARVASQKALIEELNATNKSLDELSSSRQKEMLGKIEEVVADKQKVLEMTKQLEEQKSLAESQLAAS
eukprot:TRINITY_DN1199_c0_g1_i2.p3 TRINITY_DN1199_c0_g1~~TRINITY_DN1199_c0_g1_i2.p3  ORF type:complete len:194 (+),score=75.55 TRINITY_DN1199_c0_g1_i2:312-893(+)